MKSFIKNEENFTCEKCGHRMIGNGYTNHCSKCLYSKHVDINPGDRMAKCGGLMEPLDFEVKSGEYIVTHRCVICGHKKKNKLSKEDNHDIFHELSINKAGL